MCAECVSKNKDMIVGVKVRLSASAANDGANEEEAFRYVFFLFFHIFSHFQIDFSFVYRDP